MTPSQISSTVSLASLIAVVSCTTLGPVPTSTGVSPLPQQRPGVDVQAAVVPGFHLSTTTIADEDKQGSGFPQAAAVFEPDRLLGVPGVIVGGRAIFNNPNQVEPFVGWRGYLDGARRYALAAVAYGTRSRGTERSATVDATRVGAEVIGEVELDGMFHALVGVSTTVLWAKGSYCRDDDGLGADCPETAPMPEDARLTDVLPAGRAGLALDFARNHDSAFHGGRVEISLSGGAMPRLVDGTQVGHEPYVALGLGLTMRLGARK